MSHAAPPLAPFRPAATLLAAWCVLALPPLVVARAPGALLAGHVVLLALAAWGAWRGGDVDAAPGLAARALVAWLPLLAVPLLYAELPHVAAGFGRGALHDAAIVAWERRLFGTSPARTLSARWPWRALSETLHAGYLSYYALIYVPPAWCWLRRRRDAFAASAWTTLVAFVSCYVAFVTFPVQGPWFEWPAPATIPDGPLHATVQAILRAGSSRGTAFPSSHVAVSVAQTLVLARVAPRLAVPAAIATMLLALGAVYGGLHYAVDVIVGALVGAVVGLLAPRALARLAPVTASRPRGTS